MTVTVEWCLLSSKADLFLGIMNHKMNGDYLSEWSGSDGNSLFSNAIIIWVWLKVWF